MHVCDITREDQVVATATIEFSGAGEVGSTPDTFTLDLGQRALKALETQNWMALHQMTPPSLRKKDPVKAAAAKKAAATKARKGRWVSPATQPAAAPENTTRGNATPPATETGTGAPSGVADDPLDE